MSRASWYDDRQARFSNVVLESPSGKPGIILTVPIHNAQDECIGLLAGLFNIPPSSASSLYGGLRRGMGLRGEPEQRITNFIGVPSVDEHIKKIESAGGKVLNKLPVPGWGYMAMCLDTEGNLFGIWEENENAE